MSFPFKILLVEDDINLAYLLGEHFNESGFEVSIFNNGKEGLSSFLEKAYDLCLLDILLPEMDGLNLAKEVKRSQPKMPIVFLTSRNLKSDKLLGYEIGADDYITKPFDVDVLTSKIRAVLKRSYPSTYADKELLKIGDCTLEMKRKKLNCPNTSITLNVKECSILEILILAKGQPVSRRDIMLNTWGKDDFYLSKSLDVYISKVRKIIRENTGLQLETIHAFGYSLSTKASK